VPAAAAGLARRLRSGALRAGDINQFLDSDPASAASSNVRPPAVFRRLRMIIWNTRSILMSS